MAEALSEESSEDINEDEALENEDYPEETSGKFTIMIKKYKIIALS